MYFKNTSIFTSAVILVNVYNTEGILSSLSLTLFFSLVSLRLIAILKNLRVWGISHVKIPIMEALCLRGVFLLPAWW